jgi:hypothetical protein
VGLSKTFKDPDQASAKDMHCEVDLRVDEDGTVGDFDAILISQSDNDPDISYSSFSFLAGGQWGVEEYESFTDGGSYGSGAIPLPSLQTGLWRHFVIDLSFATKTAVYSATDTSLDGTTYDAGSLTLSMTAPQTTYSRSIAIGVNPNYAPAGTTPWQSRFDNVWCNFTP